MSSAPPTRPRRPRAGVRPAVAVLGLLAGALAATGLVAPSAVAAPAVAAPAVAAPAVAAPAVARAVAAATTYGAPSWWNGDCDANHWNAAARAAGWTGAGATRLGASYMNIPVCGPRALAGAPNIWWSRPGWGELEWQCVEYAQRFMIQVYGVSPYQANGVDVVNHYTGAQGGGLVKVTNGTAGSPPRPGDVVSFSSPTNVFGHVAVVESSTVDGAGNGAVRLLSQNDTPDGWRTLTVTNWRMAAFGSLYPYGWLHDPLNRGVSTPTPVPVPDGTFVQLAGTGEVYRMAGGAPVYVSSWAVVGGLQPVVTVGPDQWATLRTLPADGTFLRSAVGSGTYRVAGGAALAVTCGTGMSGCAGAVPIDPTAVSRAGTGFPWNHLRALPADGTFLHVADDGVPAPGTYARVAGAAMLPIPDCTAVGGCPAEVTVPAATVAAYRAAHPVPADGTVLRRMPSNTYGTFYRGHCALTTAAAASITVGDASIGCPPQLAIADVVTTTLVAGRPGSTTLAASGGAAPYTWSFTVGTLPAGLSLSPSGVLSGTFAGPFSVGLRTVDRTGAWGLRTVTVPVRPPLAIVANALRAAAINRPYAARVTAGGGTGAYVFALVGGTLPGGLRLASDGTISGTATALGSATVRIAVTDAGGAAYADSGEFTVAVGPAGGIGFPTTPAPSPS